MSEIRCKNGIWEGKDLEESEVWTQFRRILLKRLTKYPGRWCQIDALNDCRIHYKELSSRVIKCAFWLLKQDLERSDIVTICSYRHLDTIVPFLACLLVGVMVHPWWDDAMSDDTSKHFLYQTRPKIVFTDETKAHEMKKFIDEQYMPTEIITLNNVPGFETLSSILDSIKLEELPDFQCTVVDDLDKPALIINTAGSTGYPKAVIMNCGWMMQFIVQPDGHQVIHYWPGGINWSVGVMNTLRTIFACSTSVIHPKCTDDVLLKLIERYEIESIDGIDTSCATRMCAADTVKQYNVSSVKSVMTTGSTMHPRAEKFLVTNFENARIMHGYYCTEAGWVCFRPEWTGKPSSCGRICDSMHMKIVDRRDGTTVLGPSVEGEIWIRYLNAFGMISYFEDPAEGTVLDYKGWFNTGDIGYYDGDGDLFLIDRANDFVTYSPKNSYASSMMEELLMRCKGVSEAAVVVKNRSPDIERPTIFLAALPKALVIEKEVFDYARKYVPTCMHFIQDIIILNNLPHSESGKLLKKELRERIPDVPTTAL